MTSNEQLICSTFIQIHLSYCLINGDQPHYVWVPMVVLLQAGLSYLPHYLWYHAEGGRMKSMLAKLMERPKFFSANKRKQRKTVMHGNTVSLQSSG